MPDLLHRFRMNLRQRRKEEQMSQTELARRCDFDRTYIGKIERGTREPSLQTIEVICQVLETGPIELFQEPNNDSDCAA